MKLQSQISRVHKDKEYRKHWVVIPNEIVKELNWKTGNELEAKIERDVLRIKLK